MVVTIHKINSYLARLYNDFRTLKKQLFTAVAKRKSVKNCG
ncbi:hypothetical protein FLA_4459 [Filimonas lacunae]|nr:hypothetical protein FLA_4459 [Filimonas lacunae]